jgi:hypothetical protein
MRSFSGWRLGARRITDLDQALESHARRIVLKWPAARTPAAFAELGEILARFRPGPCAVTIEYRGTTATGALTLGAEWSVRPARELLFALEALVGRDGIELRFGGPPAGQTESLADAGPRP